MKIGTSLNRCVRDIYEGAVDIDDVLVIVARTNFDPEDDAHWKAIWEGYSRGNRPRNKLSALEWTGIPDEDEQAVRDICIALQKRGKLHQPRQFGAHTTWLTHHWYDVILTDNVLNSNPAAQEAWKHYKTIAGLSR
jgi:hypothetical protein